MQPNHFLSSNHSLEHCGRQEKLEAGIAFLPPNSLLLLLLLLLATATAFAVVTGAFTAALASVATFAVFAATASSRLLATATAFAVVTGAFTAALASIATLAVFAATASSRLPATCIRIVCTARLTSGFRRLSSKCFRATARHGGLAVTVIEGKRSGQRYECHNGYSE